MNDNDIFLEWLFLKQLGTQSKMCRVDVADCASANPVWTVPKRYRYHKHISKSEQYKNGHYQ